MAFISSGYNPAKPMEGRITDIGPRKYDEFFRRSSKKNFGKWLYHEILEPGVLMHVAEGGDKVYTVRVGGTRTMSITHIRELCDIADKYCGGYLRWTTRSNIEFMVEDEDTMKALRDELNSRKFDGGSFKVPRGRHRCRCQQHGAHPGLGALPHPRHRRFRPREMRHGRHVRGLQEHAPARARAHLPGLLHQHVRRRALLRHRPGGHPPQTAHDRPRMGRPAVRDPLAVAACPTAAVRPTKVEHDGKKVNSIAIKQDRCMYCGNCYTMCPALPIADHEGDGIAIMVGGKVSNRISMPKFSKVVVGYIPNEPPRWPTLTKTVKHIVEVYAANANKYERLGDWAERIGWESFFKLTGLKFTHHLIDDFRDPAYYTWRQSTQFKF